MNELKACPFCNGEVRFVRGLDGDAVGIYCRGCKVLVKFQIVMNAGETYGENADRAIEAWNRRTSDAYQNKD